jgi:HK97 family phage major capsid protein
MSAKLTVLRNEINEIADRLEVLTGLESRSAVEDKEIDSLTVRSEEARQEMEREEEIQKRMAALRTITGRSAPRPAEGGAGREPHPIQPGTFHYRDLTCFPGPSGERDAYRAGQFYLATIWGVESAKRYCAEHGIVSRAISSVGQVEGEALRGGNLVQPEVLATILRNVDNYGSFARNAYRQPMKSLTLSVPRRTKGVSAFYVDEGDTIQQDKANWDRVTLTCKKAGIIVPLTSEVLDDSIVDIGQAVTEEIAMAFAQKSDEDGFLGDGGTNAGGFTGIIPLLTGAGYAASVITAGAGEVSFETLKIETFIKAVASIPRWARANAKWYVSAPGYAASMQRIQLAAGGTLPSDIADGTAGARFMGYPVVDVVPMNSVLGSNPSQPKVLFGDLSKAAMYGVRRELEMKTSEHRNFEFDQILLRATTRWAINCHTVGTNTVTGPMVVIKTAAA